MYVTTVNPNEAIEFTTPAGEKVVVFFGGTVVMPIQAQPGAEQPHTKVIVDAAKEIKIRKLDHRECKSAMRERGLNRADMRCRRQNIPL